jgi:hypothetical protein
MSLPWERYLGNLPDHAIAERYGVHHKLVRDVRVGLGIAPCGRWRTTVVRESAVVGLLRSAGPLTTVVVAVALDMKVPRARWLLLRLHREGLLTRRRLFNRDCTWGLHGNP